MIDSATLEEYPQLRDVYDQISPALTDEVLQELNRQVDVEGRERRTSRSTGWSTRASSRRP